MAQRVFGRGRRSWAAALAVLALALVVGGCAGEDPAGGPEQVGPSYTLGPVPLFDATGRVGEGGRLAWYQTRDGACTKYEDQSGRGCGGWSGGLPDGCCQVSGTETEQLRCVEALAGKRVRRVQVSAAGLDPVVLTPLPGSELAPVNVFVACWSPVDAIAPLHDVTVTEPWGGA